MLKKIIQKEQYTYPSLSGIYIHIPFCKRKCHYCDFYSTTDLNIIPDFIESLKREISLYQNSNMKFDTIYFGGGTPSLLTSKQIKQILSKLYSSFNISKNSEITLEANPKTLDKEKLFELLDSGINRIIIGVQSFINSNLNLLGRIHNEKDSIKAIENAKSAGFTNFGIDIIFGIPEQNFKDLKHDLNLAVSYELNHISTYLLTYEPGTVLYNKIKNNIFSKLNDIKCAGMLKYVQNYFQKKQYEQYEISNYSKNKFFRSKHNQKYWIDINYLGFGPSAHSYLKPRRYWNINSINKYIKILNNNKLPVSGSELLTIDKMMIEFIYLNLRRIEGLNTQLFEKKFNVNFFDIYKNELSSLIDNKFIRYEDNFLCLTKKGKLLSDSVIGAFFN